MDRRRFLKIAGAQAGLLATGACARNPSLAPVAPATGSPEIVVVGAGAFGGWTAFHLRQMGHDVTLVDAYGPGNSRATSGDETRGIRTGYGDKGERKELWTRWASEAIRRWEAWDQEWETQLFSKTGDLIMREDWDDFLTQTRDTWDAVGVRYEVLSHDELKYRYPQINVEGINVTLHELDAGVGRSRMACLTVADRFQDAGGRVLIDRAELGGRAGDRLENVKLASGETLGAQLFVFALGPWFPKAFPEVMGSRIRIPMGHVFYYGTPPGDSRFTFPNMPSYNFRGVTGWAALGHDNRGFRVRTGGHQDDDPDTSVRWIDPQYHERSREVLRERFPAMADAPLVETRSCHYELSSSRNFIIDRHPDYSNVWFVGGGSAEGFKFGPVVGEYAAERVTGQNHDSALAAAFALPEQTFDPARSPPE